MKPPEDLDLSVGVQIVAASLNGVESTIVPAWLFVGDVLHVKNDEGKVVAEVRVRRPKGGPWTPTLPNREEGE